MSIVTTTSTDGNFTHEEAGLRLYQSGQYWVEGDTGHVCDDGHVYPVPVRDTGPVCYCREFVQWGTCAHAVCILHWQGEAEPTDDELADEWNAGYIRDTGMGNFR